MDTNQNPEVFEESLFDDDSFEEEESLFDEEVETESTPAKEEADPKPNNVQAEPFLKIKYNKEEKGLSHDEAIELAQKGMNYDKVLGQFNTMNSRIEMLARANGMDVESYFKSLEDAQVEFETSRELEELKKQYPNSDEALLKEIASNRIASRRNEQGRLAQEEKNNEEAKNRVEIQRQVELFNKRYPNLEADKLDNKVYDLMKEGYTLLEAYTIFKENAESEAKAKEQAKQQVALQNEANKKRGLGNISSTGNVEVDDFLSGFNF